MVAESVDITFECWLTFNIQMLFQYILTFKQELQGATALLVCALMLYVGQSHSSFMSCGSASNLSRSYNNY